MRQHAEESTKKHKALACLQSGVSDVIFTRIMACSTPKEAWGKLREEFMGSNKTRQQQVINLRRDFENLKIKESETIKQYSDRITTTVNSIRLLGEDFSDSRVVEKEGPIGRKSILNELSKQRPKIVLVQVRKERSLGLIRGRNQGKIQFGHVEKVCKNKGKAPAQQQIQAQAAEDLQAQKEHVFTASCSATLNKARCNWLVDSGCTHHMAADESLFKDLDKAMSQKSELAMEI
ncbi:uncharacterized protein [Gossypium hirsutum]|uniref:Retrovirus-related Pol polyprotein from transposon TNT 1-94-like beta-barrel domain-containing protein n=1 Tax=Gossypium hirsutum TaxID=3635 RepID=A0A1U8HV47_GOSHI|nr:uncharacterized protein LOC107887482 [Gossypium hirsutum]